MKSIKPIAASGLVLVSLLAFAADAWKRKVEESFISFDARSAVGRVHGKIPGLQAEIKFSENDLINSSFNAWLSPEKLDTENKKRDNHLRSEDFLDVLKYPAIKFVSKKIVKTDSGFEVT